MSRATSSEKNTAAATVSPNCMKYWPVMPRHEAHRQEHGDDRGGRGDHREADLVRRIERGLEAGLAHAHVAHDVLDLDDGVVDQHARDERQREQAHLVEREAHPSA